MVSKARILIPALVIAVGCSSQADQDTSEMEQGATESEANMSEAGPPPVAGDTVTTDSGLQYILIQAGNGPAAELGRQVRVHYTGWFTDGKKFDSSVGGEPLTFLLGRGNVISGWDEGVADMQVGEKRRFIVPPQLAYGERGYPGAIPPNATLIFDVELLGIEE
jgi:FKBP-type peptidyl-prolyl cis-trans isomerase